MTWNNFSGGVCMRCGFDPRNCMCETLSAPPFMVVATADTTAFDAAFQHFLTDVRRWREWVNGMLVRAQRMLAAAKARPPRLAHDGNMWKAPDGSIWQMCRAAGARGMEEVTREKAFDEYTPTGKTHESWGDALGWTRSSYDAPEDDWPWRPDRYGNGTLAHTQSGIRYDEAGLAFADAVLALDPERLRTWMYARGQSAPVRAADPARWDGRDGALRERHHVDDDWSALVHAFGLPNSRDLPDRGSLLCALHAAIDRASPATLEMRYAH